MRQLIALLCILVGPAFADGTIDVRDYVVGPGQGFSGRTHESLINDWWQWAYLLDERGVGPTTDETGALCAANQRGRIWYLAGSFDAGRVQRQCEIPAGQAVFFPIINHVAYALPGSSETCSSMKYTATKIMNRKITLGVTLDGQEVPEVERFRFRSPVCFDLLGRRPRGENRLRYEPAAADGYWMLLRPLPPGRYELTFYAYQSWTSWYLGFTGQNITYDLTVVDE